MGFRWGSAASLPVVLAAAITVIAVAPVALSGSGSGSETVAQMVVGPESDARVDDSRVDRVLASLTLTQRIGQMVLAYPQLDGEGPVEVGGVLFVGKMLDDRRGAAARISSTLRRAEIPPFFAVDMEGGDFNRMKSHPDLAGFPAARSLAALPDLEVERWGQKVGRAMREVGLNMNLAPVLDVSPTGHMYDNKRSFSGDPDVVTQKAIAFARGLALAGVVPVGKHFPGYGDLGGDTDRELVLANWTADQVAHNMRVFDDAEDWLGGVMMSNAAYAPYGKRPAMLTPALVSTARARGWLTVTDDLAIGVLAKTIGGTQEDVLEQAFLAGNDLLLTTAPPDWDKGVDYLGVLTALVESDPKLVERVDDSCRRILRLKDRLGLLDAL